MPRLLQSLLEIMFLVDYAFGIPFSGYAIASLDNDLADLSQAT